MADPTFIRFFAATDRSQIAELAWNFMRRMIRLRPVRVISMSGGMAGRWVGYETLTATPMIGSYVNVICCDSSRWTWTTHVEAPTKAQSPAQVAAGGAFEAEQISSRAELWTAGVRNVLIVGSPPRSKPEVDTAKKYDEIIAPSVDIAAALARADLPSWVCAHPYDGEIVRNLILGAT
jgi:hypothetical protein